MGGKSYVGKVEDWLAGMDGGRGRVGGGKAGRRVHAAFVAAAGVVHETAEMMGVSK